MGGARSRGARRPVYRRVLLKLSGEALLGEGEHGIAPEVVAQIAGEVREVHERGVEMGIVIGGGNIFRGTLGDSLGMDRVAADHMGMLATVINGLALQDALERGGVMTRLLSAIEMRQVAEPFIRRRAIRHLEKGRVGIFAAGTGNPYFSTDTAAALRALEIRADVILKATRVDGIYDSDPETNRKARKFKALTYQQVLERNLRVMDAAAISLCRDNALPIVVFKLLEPGNIMKVILGEGIGTVVRD